MGTDRGACWGAFSVEPGLCRAAGARQTGAIRVRSGVHASTFFQRRTRLKEKEVIALAPATRPLRLQRPISYSEALDAQRGSKAPPAICISKWLEEPRKAWTSCISISDGRTNVCTVGVQSRPWAVLDELLPMRRLVRTRHGVVCLL